MPRNVYVEFPDGTVIRTEQPDLYRDAKRVPAAEGERKRREHARAKLLQLLAPGARVYTVLRHASSSGMQRRIDLYCVEDGELRYLSGYAADVIGATVHAKGGIVVNGCGMDMGFDLVYRLGAGLWPDGTPQPHSTRNGAPDSAGGYALRHEWI